MCFGGPPVAQPQIERQSTQPDNSAAMAQYAEQMAAQSQAMQSQIADQIASITAETNRMQQQYQVDQEKLAAEQAAMAANKYITEAEEGEFTANAQTTDPAKKKQEDSLSTLKITTGALPASSGAGLNIGV